MLNQRRDSDWEVELTHPLKSRRCARVAVTNLQTLQRALVPVHPRHVAELISSVDVEEHGKLHIQTSLLNDLIESQVSDASEIPGIDDAHDHLPVQARGVGDTNDKALHVTMIRSAPATWSDVLCAHRDLHTPAVCRRRACLNYK